MNIFRLEGIGVIDATKAPPSTGPKWCRLFPGPTTRYRPDFPEEGITFDASFFEGVQRSWAALGRPPLPVDYAHDEEGIAAGWITDMRVAPEGLEVLIEWTARARAAIDAKELQFLSPTFVLEHMSPLDGQDMGPTIFGAALLNTPFLHDLPAVQATKYVSRALTTERKQMSDFPKNLRAALGVAEDADDEACMSALGAMKERMGAFEVIAKQREDEAAKRAEEEKAKEDEGKAKEAASIAQAIEMTSTPLLAKASALELERNELKARIVALEAERTAMGVEELVRVSLARGVANAKAQVDKALKLGGNLERAKEIVSMIPATVVVGEVGISGDGSAMSPADAYALAKAEAHKLMEAQKIDYQRAFELAVKSNPALAAHLKGQ